MARVGLIHFAFWVLGASCSSQQEIMSITPTATSSDTSTSPQPGPYSQYRNNTANPPANNTAPAADSTKSDPRHSDKLEEGDKDKQASGSKIGSGKDDSESDLAPVIRPNNTNNSNKPNGQATPSNIIRSGVGFDQVFPILKQSCNGCHNPNGRNPDLTVYSRARAVGPAIVRTAASDSPTMPEGDPKLSEQDKATLRAWKDSGYIETSK